MRRMGWLSAVRSAVAPVPAIDAPINAVTAMVKLILYAIALAIQPVLDTVTLAIHVCGGLLMAIRLEPVGALVQTLVDTFATVVEAFIDGARRAGRVAR